MVTPFDRIPSEVLKAMKTIGSPAEMTRRKIKIERPSTQPPEVDSRIWHEVQHYLRQIPEELEPNMGRVAEIKQEIQDGVYLTPEMVDEVAARLAARFLKKM